MPEHTIPGSLIENIRSGRAALVVGAGVGAASWKQLLERMNERLRERGKPGDAEAAADVDKLLHKANLARAAGFLGRTLGEEVCDQVVAETWQSSDDLPALARALARLPFRQIWTTFPGQTLEEAAEVDSPEGWPELSVKTYADVADVHRRRRTLVKILGDFDSYIVTPKSVRRVLAGADALRDYARDFYADGSLVFVGFRFGDPDLSALLDRVFGTFEPPEQEHYLLAAGAGPVTVEELMSEHHIEVINLPGRGADDTATAGLLGWLQKLGAECTKQGISLSQEKPEANDLEGWIELLSEDPQGEMAQDGLAALDRIEAAAKAAGDSERLIEVILSRVEIDSVAVSRGALLRRAAEIFEAELGDIPRALTALTAALREDPANSEALDVAERLAAESDGWAELVADVAEVAGELEDRQLSSAYWTRLGRWYDKELHHIDYAVAAYREALKKNATASGAHDGLADIFRRQQRWADLADTLARHVDIETDVAKQVEIYLGLGELYESHLTSGARAIEAYEMAAELDEDCDDAWRALERMHRKNEKWSALAQVMDSRIRLFERNGDTARVNAIRGEMSQLRADKLGDIDASIRKAEADLSKAPTDIKVMRRLEELYGDSGRPSDQLRLLGEMVDLVSPRERRGVLSRLAKATEKLADDPAAVVVAYRKLVEVTPSDTNARQGLARALHDAGDWEALVAAHESHLEIAKAPVDRAGLRADIADIYENELDDGHKAIDAHLVAVGECEDFGRSLTSLTRLYEKTENWDRALNITVTHAEADGSADLWRQAGSLAGERLGRSEEAREHFEKALSSDRGHIPTLLALAKLHEDSEDFHLAADRILEAESRAQERSERIGLLFRAASLYHDKKGDHRRALVIYRKVLELDNEHAGALTKASEILSADGRWNEALPYLELLAADTTADGPARAQRLVAVAKAFTELEQPTEAAGRYEAASAADPGSIDIAILAIDAQIGAANDKAGWTDVEKRAEALVSNPASSASPEQKSMLWNRVGVAALKGGDDGKAEKAFRKSLACDAHYAPSLSGLIDVSAARGDFKTVVHAKREQLATTADEAQQAILLEEIGDVYVEHLRNPDQALAMYRDALAIRPDYHVLLHKTLEIYSEKRQWKPALDALDALVFTAKNPIRRAKYHYTAAVIARDELRDRSAAAERFERCLVDDPTNKKAFDAIDAMYSENSDYQGLVRAYKKLLNRGDDAPTEQQVAIWSRLGSIFLDHLDDAESAMAALEVAADLEPANMERHEQLVNLYLEAGEAKRDEAIDELQVLIRHAPDRVELYHALFALYEQNQDTDRCFCVAQALVFLGAASDEQKAIYAANRSDGFSPAKRKLTEELWQKAIIHERENRYLNAIFSSVVGALASTTARPASAYNMSPGERADLDLDHHTVSKIFKYSSEVLALEPRPSLYVREGGEDALRVANTAEEGRLVPAMFAGGGHASKGEPRELAFELGKRLAYFRPERFVNFALSGLPKVEEAFAATLAATGTNENVGEGASRLADRLRKLVPRPVLDQVGAVARKLNADPNNGVVAGWRTATDLTANRVGLILCNDLTTAARLIAQESSPMSTLSTKDRLRDLIAYSASEEYFAVRRHLGLTVSR